MRPRKIGQGGQLRAERDESVNTFDDASVLTRGNQRVRRYEGFDALYELDGVWRLVGGVQSTATAEDHQREFAWVVASV